LSASVDISVYSQVLYLLFHDDLPDFSHGSLQGIADRESNTEGSFVLDQFH